MPLKMGLLCRHPELYSNQRIIDEALKRGHSIEVIDFVNCDLRVDNSKLDVYYEGKSLSYLDAVIPRISVQFSFYGLAVVRQFESMGTFCLNSSLGINNSRDKLRSLQILASHNIPVPASAISNSTLNSEKIMKDLKGAPLVIKLIEGMQGVGTILAESDQAGMSVIEALSSLKAHLILQEFVAEAKGKDVRVIVIDGKVEAAMERVAKEGEFRSNLHRGGSSHKVELTPREIEVSILAASKLDLRVAGVDIIRSKRGPLVLEVNSSAGLTGIERTTELNLAEKIISLIETSVKK